MTVLKKMCAAMALTFTFTATTIALAGGYGGDGGGGGGGGGGKATQIENKKFNTCLTGSTTPAPVTLAACTNADNQKFVIEPAPGTTCLSRIRLKNTNLCLADPGTVPGQAALTLETCSPTDQDQRWIIHQCDGAHLIINGRTGGHLEATSATTVVTDDIIDDIANELWKLDIKDQCKGGGKQHLLDDSMLDIDEFSDEDEDADE